MIVGAKIVVIAILVNLFAVTADFVTSAFSTRIFVSTFLRQIEATRVGVASIHRTGILVITVDIRVSTVAGISDTGIIGTRIVIVTEWQIGAFSWGRVTVVTGAGIFIFALDCIQAAFSGIANVLGA
jgi:hypothetical protein